MLLDSDDTILNYYNNFWLHFMQCRYNSDNRSAEETQRKEDQEMLSRNGRGVSSKGNDKSPCT